MYELGPLVAQLVEVMRDVRQTLIASELFNLGSLLVQPRGCHVRGCTLDAMGGPRHGFGVVCL